MAGNQATLRSLQAKLAIGSVNDPLERDADAVADRVMQTQDPQTPSQRSAPKLSRKCSTCEEEGKGTVQAKSAGSRNGGGEAPGSVHDVVNSPGQPLDAGTRAFFEPRFGADFSGVRVHTDGKAAQSARDVGARGYTVGQHIAFGDGNFAPATNSGRQLIAHELAHVVQQDGAQLHRDPDPEQAQPQADGQDVDDGEVQDGDCPVSATSDAPQSEDSDVPDTENTDPVADPSQAQPGQDPAVDTVDQADPMQSGGKKGKGKTPPPKTPAKPKAPPKKITHIDVDQASQMMTLTWSDGSTEKHAVSTGKGKPNTKEDPCKDQTEENCTPNVTDQPVGSMGNASTKNEHGDAMSWYVGVVDSRGIGIHDSQPVPGVPASHGCVRVGSTPADDAFAKKINKNVITSGKDVTTVTIHGKAATKPWTKPVPAKPKPKAKK